MSYSWPTTDRNSSLRPSRRQDTKPQTNLKRHDFFFGKLHQEPISRSVRTILTLSDGVLPHLHQPRDAAVVGYVILMDLTRPKQPGFFGKLHQEPISRSVSTILTLNGGVLPHLHQPRDAAVVGYVILMDLTRPKQPSIVA